MNKNFKKKTAYDYVQQTKKGLEVLTSSPFCIIFYSLLNSKIWKMSVFRTFTVVSPSFISVSK